MPNGQESIEIERLLNLVRGFGWNLRKQEFETDKVVVVLTKDRIVGAVETGAGPG